MGAALAVLAPMAAHAHAYGLTSAAPIAALSTLQGSIFNRHCGVNFRAALTTKCLFVYTACPGLNRGASSGEHLEVAENVS